MCIYVTYTTVSLSLNLCISLFIYLSVCSCTCERESVCMCVRVCGGGVLEGARKGQRDQGRRTRWREGNRWERGELAYPQDFGAAVP